MPLPVYKTMGQLRVKLARRLGFAANANAANADSMRDLLEEAHQQIYERLDERIGDVLDYEFETVTGRWAYDYDLPQALDPDTGQPADPQPPPLDPERISYVYVFIYDTHARPLVEDFTLAAYDLRDTYDSWPVQYRRRAQLEVFPTPDQQYRVVVGAQQRLGEFEDDADRSSVPDDMVLMEAILRGYEIQGRQPPALTASRLERRIRQVRSRAHANAAYPGNMQGAPTHAILPPPRWIPRP